MTRELTCIICPLGCNIKIESEGKNIINITGNTCPRGKKYAETEFTNPQRTVTTTVKAVTGETVSVKTNRPISKENIFNLMKIVNNTKIHLPICIGDVIIKDIYGCDVIATKNIGDVISG